jgi:hypothetical protein
MAAQYGKMAKRGCHSALGRDDGKLCEMSSRRGIEKVKVIKFSKPEKNFQKN